MHPEIAVAEGSDHAGVRKHFKRVRGAAVRTLRGPLKESPGHARRVFTAVCSRQRQIQRFSGPLQTQQPVRVLLELQAAEFLLTLQSLLVGDK